MLVKLSMPCDNSILHDENVTMVKTIWNIQSDNVCFNREAMIPCILLALGGNLVDGKSTS